MASILYGLAGKLLGELCSPLFQEYVGKPWRLGSNDEFERLKSTLSAIEAVLLDAEEKQRTNRQIQDWLVKIKLVLYDVEDLVQEVTTEALRRQVMTKKRGLREVRDFLSSSNQVNYRYEMGRKVKLIRESLDAIASDRNAFNFTERREEMHVSRGRRREETHSFVPLDKFIGRGKDKEYVTKLLLESEALDNVSVISIVAMGGMGKTTLAQSIYSSEEVKGKFELMMWVCVSDVFDVKLICENIVESATKEKCERLQMDGVKNKLKNEIDGKKYLLVLDDVWNVCRMKWMELEVLLSGGARGSKILITARAKVVAEAANSIATHFLKGLSDEESWVLFEKVAFKRGAETKSSRIVEIGKEVVEICAGVPLALKTIGSMLSLKEKETDWLDFQKYDLPRITQDGEGPVVPILKLSYDFLSAPLKRCFAFCAVLPKDYEFQKKELIGMWMAQGLVQLDGTTRSLEDVGEHHFMDLLDRSFFEGSGIAFILRRDVYKYKMHDLIHDLALSLGGNEYYNLGSGANSIDKLTRHAWVPSLHVTTSLLHAKQLRTLVVVSDRPDRDEEKVDEIMSVFQKLRVLVLANLHITRVLHGIDGLRHLSYLDLSNNDFVILPESICSLYNLQTLILRGCEKLKELPAGTRNLVSLRHLDIWRCWELSHMPRGLGELTNLQTLSAFVMGPEGTNCCQLGELNSLVSLRGSLEIRKLRGSKVVKCTEDRRLFYPDVLTQLKSIQHLVLEWRDWIYEDIVMEEEVQLVLFESLRPHSNLETLEIIGYRGKRFPSWMDTVSIGVSLPNIVVIKLWNCKNWQHIAPLGLLPSLQKLFLNRLHGIEYLCDSSSAPKESDQLFPSLKELELRGMQKLRRFLGPTSASRLNNSNRHFPVLEKLKITSCPLFVSGGSDEDGKQFMNIPSLRVVEIGWEEMETLPAWLQFLPHLQTLELDCCGKIVSLPEWMGNLTSLDEIRLRACGSLASIPDCIQRLTSLKRLVVAECPKLLGRCEKVTGEDWHKIAHIPDVKVKKHFYD